jgi:hypothetical protein
LGNGADVQTNCVDYEVVMQQLHEWARRESASALAGLSESSASRRRRLVNRIDAAIETAPPHSRGRRLESAAKARRVAAAHHSAAIEAELESLTLAPFSDDEWLAAVAKLAPTRATSAEAQRSNSGLTVHALLLLCCGASKRVQCLQPE